MPLMYCTKYRRLFYLLELLEKKRVATPYDICQKLNCSDKTARRMLNALRNEGHAIRFCKRSKRYLLTK